jgi:hypothetical protein
VFKLIVRPSRSDRHPMHTQHVSPPIVLPRKEFRLQFSVLALLDNAKIFRSRLVHSVCVASQVSGCAKSCVTLSAPLRFEMISHMAATIWSKVK